MTNNDVLNIAMRQSAIDSSCDPDDFKSSENKLVISKNNADARKYLELPFLCDLTSYGNNIVASVSSELSEIASDYIGKYPVMKCFETPGLNELSEKIKMFDMAVCFMAEYFLPDVTVIKPLECDYKTKIIYSSDFEELYLPEWGNALCKKRKQLDQLAVGAYHDGRLIGLAACSADCGSMWQIGIDVLPAYRNQGIASCLTSRLAVEILSRDIVPFYCCAWSNIGSARNAIKSGFKPAWVQVTAAKNDFIRGLGGLK